MNRAELEASWQITRQHLSEAWALLPSAPQENSEEGASVSLYHEFLRHNELGLALETLVQLGKANNCPASFWRELSAAAENMGLGPFNASGESQ